MHYTFFPEQKLHEELVENVFANEKYDSSKRVLDIILGIMLFVAVLPVFVFSVCAIKICMGGNVIYRQKRVGRKGKFFTMYKFRTLKTEENFDHSGNGPSYNCKKKLIYSSNDKRITKLGRILRKSSIDELPQLINVIKGDMSLVGPRPLIPDLLAGFRQFTSVRNLVKPGITGLWQVRDRRNKNSTEAMMPHDLEYVRNYDLKMDIKILLMTIPAVMKWNDAY